MRRTIYHYSYGPQVNLSDVRDTFRLAYLATQSVYGHRRALLEANFDLDDADRSGWIDARNDVGQHLHRVFMGYLRREFGDDHFTVRAGTETPRGESICVPA